MTRLQQYYQENVVKTLQKELGLDNVMAVPTVKKIVVSTRVHEDQHQDAAMENVKAQLEVITGMKPKVTVARKSESSFKIRQGEPLGMMVTLRGQYMWEFLDKLVKIVLPRVKDFQGISLKSFDQSGNYNLGLPEQIIFPEIVYDKIDKIRGLQITIVTNAGNKDNSIKLLKMLGMPFEKLDNK